MAEELKKTKGDENNPVGELTEKTQQIEIIKFHPLVAHEVGDQPIVLESTAKDLIERKFAKALK